MKTNNNNTAISRSHSCFNIVDTEVNTWLCFAGACQCCPRCRANIAPQRMLSFSCFPSFIPCILHSFLALSLPFSFRLFPSFLAFGSSPFSVIAVLFRSLLPSFPFSILSLLPFPFLPCHSSVLLLLSLPVVCVCGLASVIFCFACW